LQGGLLSPDVGLGLALRRRHEYRLNCKSINRKSILVKTSTYDRVMNMGQEDQETNNTTQQQQ